MSYTAIEENPSRSRLVKVVAAGAAIGAAVFGLGAVVSKRWSSPVVGAEELAVAAATVSLADDDWTYCSCTAGDVTTSCCAADAWVSPEECYSYCGCVCTGGDDDWYPFKPSPKPTQKPTREPTLRPTVAPTASIWTTISTSSTADWTETCSGAVNELYVEDGDTLVLEDNNDVMIALTSDVDFDPTVSGAVRFTFEATDNDYIWLAPFGDDGPLLLASGNTDGQLSLEWQTSQDIADCSYGSTSKTTKVSGYTYTDVEQTMEVSWDSDFVYGNVTLADGTSTRVILTNSGFSAGKMVMGQGYMSGETYYTNVEYIIYGTWSPTGAPTISPWTDLDTTSTADWTETCGGTVNDLVATSDGVLVLTDNNDKMIALTSTTDLDPTTSGKARFTYISDDNDWVWLAPFGDNGPLFVLTSNQGQRVTIYAYENVDIDDCSYGTRVSSVTGSNWDYSEENKLLVSWDARFVNATAVYYDGTQVTLSLANSGFSTGAMVIGVGYMDGDTYFSDVEYLYL